MTIRERKVKRLFLYTKKKGDKQKVRKKRKYGDK